MKRIIVCGCRDWGVVPKDPNAIAQAVSANRERGALVHAISIAVEGFSSTDDVTIVNGACSGADTLAGSYADDNGLGNEKHPADWHGNGRAAGPIRNQEMVDLGANLCIAAWDGVSAGTGDMIKRCVKAGIPVQIVPRKEAMSG